MNFTKLEQHMIDTIEEQQLKLGYLQETVRLYYPLVSLNRFLEVDASIDEMREILQVFGERTSHTLGGVLISNQGERFCLAVPPSGARYIHEQMKDNSFLSDLIACVSNHGNTWEQVLSVFQKHSDRVHVEQVNNGEFNYLVYFEEGSPDNYRYCIADEGHHVTYHRYTPEDYADFGF